MRDRPRGLTPQLRTGPFVVCQRVVGVGELIENDAAPFVAHRLGDVARQFHAALARRQYQFGTKSLHRLPTFHTLVFGHDQDHPVTAQGSRHRQSYPGVTGSRLDQRVAWLDVTALLGACNHRQCRSILHRTGRVVTLELGQQPITARFADGTRQAFQTHQRGVADVVFERLIHGCTTTRRTARRLRRRR